MTCEEPEPCKYVCCDFPQTPCGYNCCDPPPPTTRPIITIKPSTESSTAPSTAPNTKPITESTQTKPITDPTRTEPQTNPNSAPWWVWLIVAVLSVFLLICLCLSVGKCFGGSWSCCFDFCNRNIRSDTYVSVNDKKNSWNLA